MFLPEQGTHEVVTELRSVRRAWGFTLDELSRRSGLGRTSLIDVELGKRSPTLRTLARLAETLGYEIVLRPKQP
jgi:transcriptional regulator with XRE-family HTH domain